MFVIGGTHHWGFLRLVIFTGRAKLLCKILIKCKISKQPNAPSKTWNAKENLQGAFTWQAGAWTRTNLVADVSFFWCIGYSAWRFAVLRDCELSFLLATHRRASCSRTMATAVCVRIRQPRPPPHDQRPRPTTQHQRPRPSCAPSARPTAATTTTSPPAGFCQGMLAARLRGMELSSFSILSLVGLRDFRCRVLVAKVNFRVANFLIFTKMSKFVKKCKICSKMYKIYLFWLRLHFLINKY